MVAPTVHPPRTPAVTTHSLRFDVDAMHGAFSPDLEPVVEIASGDAVLGETADVGWGLEPPTDEVSLRKKLDRPGTPRYRGPALLGPVAVRGADPGTVLEVRIDELRPASWGWTWSGGPGEARPEVNRRLGVLSASPRLTRWTLDLDRGVAATAEGREVALRPHLGVMGLAPGAPGWHSGWAARQTGGNLDCSELVVGTSLFLPVEVEGGLLSFGDGHAAQGDGEIGGTAIECRMERVALTLSVRRDMALALPAARTPDGWVTLGYGAGLDEAALRAARGMVALLASELGVDAFEATALASVAASLRVTQMVNESVGVHAFLDHEALDALRT
ncbi:MAG: acetamidase/formamidase family protein [Gemmatimonadota bacterium]|jgi:acetamidase/formamidase